MKALLLLLFIHCLVLAYLPSNGQPTAVASNMGSYLFVNDANGHPMYLKKEYNMEGSPFYPAEPCLANVRMKGGKYYQNVSLRFYLPDEELVYQDNKGTDMTAEHTIATVSFINCGDINSNYIFRCGFPAIDGHSDNAFYQVLDSGYCQLLKGYKVSYTDQRPYGSASITRTYERTEAYYAFSPKQGIKKLEKNKESLLLFLSDKTKAVDNFISTNKLKCRKEEDLVKVFDYYNTLVQ